MVLLDSCVWSIDGAATLSHASLAEDFLLQEQAADIKILSNYVSQLRLVGRGHGVWHFDRYLYDNRGALGYDGVAHTLSGDGGNGAARGVGMNSAIAGQ